MYNKFTHNPKNRGLRDELIGKRRWPKKYGDKLSLDSIKDFHGEIIFGKYKVTHRTVKPNLLGMYIFSREKPFSN